MVNRSLQVSSLLPPCGLFLVLSSTAKLNSVSCGSELSLCESDLTFGWSELTWRSDLTMDRNDPIKI